MVSSISDVELRLTAKMLEGFVKSHICRLRRCGAPDLEIVGQTLFLARWLVGAWEVNYPTLPNEREGWGTRPSDV
jgi:hypothetical protein